MRVACGLIFTPNVISLIHFRRFTIPGVNNYTMGNYNSVRLLPQISGQLPVPGFRVLHYRMVYCAERSRLSLLS